MNAGLKRSPILNRKATNPHANLTETELLQRQIDTCRDNIHREQTQAELKAAFARIEQLASPSQPPTLRQQLDSFIEFCTRACEKAESKALMGVA
jgi:hypothetical protein